MGTHDLHLRLAQLAAKAGRRTEAAGAFAQVLHGNPYDMEAWWGLSQAVNDWEREAYCLKRVLALAPYHVAARQRLESLAPAMLSDRRQINGDRRARVASLDKALYH